MEAMTSLLSGNPFSTPVGQLIERATAPDLASEDWTLNMQICDMINSLEDGPKDGIRAIKKRISSYVGKNFSVVMYTLTVLETCVKNCGHRFHVLVAQKDFLSQLVKVISPKYEPPQMVQEKVLSLIQTWADAFKSHSDLKEITKVYHDLKSKGIEFPMTDLDTMPPILTPARTTPEVVPVGSQKPVHPGLHSSQLVNQPSPGHPSALGPASLTTDQMAKLRSELDIVQTNVRVFSEMLTELTPGNESPQDLELLQSLHRTCSQMQQRIVELLDQIAGEMVTEELLRVNDELNNVFLRYERFERNKSAPVHHPDRVSSDVQHSSSLQTEEWSRSSHHGGGDSTSGVNLIDFDSPQPQNTEDIQSRLARLRTGENSVTETLHQMNSVPATVASDDFDTFVHSRQSFDQNRPKNSSGAAAYNSKTNEGVSRQTVQAGMRIDDEGEYREMEKWLSDNKASTGTQMSASSSEFDSFLAERAKEGDSGGGGGNVRQLHKGGESEKTLFAL